MEEHSCCTPYIPDHISTKPLGGTFEAEETEIKSSSVTDSSTKSFQIVKKPTSVTNPSFSKVSLSRTCFSIDSSDNLSPPKTQKKPLLIRAEAIDLSSIPSGNNNNSSISTNLKMKHDVRPHLLVSFFAKHFEKMHKRMTKRPLGSSLSFDLDERQRVQTLQHGRDSQEDSILSLPTNNMKYPSSLYTGLNCFHCLINASLREHELNGLDDGIRLWSSSDIPSVDCTDSRQINSEKLNTNCKTSLHDSTRFVNK
uniref:Bm10415 n=1 Tax=Brugia malayi TaxID=6279 RepID=A0A1I9G0Y1_BRUMA|nr:Bm10415 [Brugia malayi]